MIYQTIAISKTSSSYMTSANQGNFILGFRADTTVVKNSKSKKIAISASIQSVFRKNAITHRYSYKVCP